MISPGLEVVFNKKIDGEIKVLYGESVTTVWRVGDSIFYGDDVHVSNHNGHIFAASTPNGETTILDSQLVTTAWRDCRLRSHHW
jgi:pectin methylesterase-like acyl-CoA thioesterase